MTARTVTALEHETIPVGDPSDGAPLDEADANALLALNERQPGFCVRTVAGVRLAQYCGLVRLRTCVVEILPKFGMAQRRDDDADVARAALLRMLRHARALAITRVGDVTQRTVRAPLLDAFIDAFLACALERARHGLVSRYVGRVDDLRVIRGRYLARHDALRNVARPHLAHCDYDDFDADNPYNRAIRAALEACRDWIRQPSLQTRWLETFARYDGVTRIPMRARDVARLPRDRTTRHYEAVLRWCELLLSFASPALRSGEAPMPALLFDMNKLFEAHVARLEHDGADDGLVVRTRGHGRALAMRDGVDAFDLQPDVAVSRVSTPDDVERIVDAKWKRLDPGLENWGVSRNDVHQMLAYAVRYRCRRIELVYPEPDRAPRAVPPTFDIALGDDAAPVRVAVRTVPLWD
ncbi:MAG TPA: hypothetical protein VJ724_05645 [Tahibacter sp.]|nr:hypothetical protein [Tahibacter sp.]